MEINQYSSPQRPDHEVTPYQPAPPSAKSKRWPKLPRLLALVGLLGLLGGLGPRLATTLSGKSGNLSVEAITQAVETQTLTVLVEGTGSVVAKNTVNLSPKTAGRLEALYTEQGEQVQAGQVLARMEVGTLAAELEQSQAQVAQAEADYARVLTGNRAEDIQQVEAEVAAAESQVVLTTAQLERYRALANRGAISQSELEQYLNQANSANASLTQAQARLDAANSGSRPEEIAAAAAAVTEARARVNAIQTQIEDATIRAPFAGVITQTYATVGAIVTPTTTASATASATSSSILALSSGLDIEIKVSEANIAQVGLDQTVDIVADAFPQQIFNGRVRRIAPEALTENNVTVFQVVVEPLTGLDQLKAGMTVDATFIGKTVADALMVPTVAIATEAGQFGVRIADESGKPVFQPVTIGLTQGGKTQILSGLEAGDRIFLDLPQSTQRSPLSPP